jgi:hypothetical protein
LHDPSQRKSLGRCSNFLAIPARKGKRDKYVGKLDNILFQLANLFTIYTIIPSNIAFDLKEAPRGSPKYFVGREDILQLRKSVNSS